jgi:hypothetical protein
MDYSKMTAAQLDAAADALHKRRVALKAEAQELQIARQRLLGIHRSAQAAERIQRELDGLSPEARDAVVRSVSSGAKGGAHAPNGGA